MLKKKSRLLADIGLIFTLTVRSNVRFGEVFFILKILESFFRLQEGKLWDCIQQQEELFQPSFFFWSLTKMVKFFPVIH